MEKTSTATTKTAAKNANVQFGSTEYADSIPECLQPDSGPVYLEGRLVLSLSFQGIPPRFDIVEYDDLALERYRIWDDLSESWYIKDLEILRFEDTDEVMQYEPVPAVLWNGKMDTQARIIQVPDLDIAGFKANQAHDLRWKRI